MSRLRYNGLVTGASGATVGLTLGASLTSSDTTVTFSAALTYNNGTAVPTIVSPDYIPLSILDAATGNLSEIVYLTAYTSGATSGTITRAQESTTGVAHASGDRVVSGPTVLDLSAVSSPPVYSGLYYTYPYSVASTAASPSAGAMQLVWVPCPPGSAFDQIAIECVASGTGSLRIGLYDLTSSGKPNALIADGGVFTAAATGSRTGAISVTVSGAAFYIGVLHDVAGTGTFRLSTSTPGTAALGYSQVVSPAIHTRLEVSGVTTGALPSTAPAGLVPVASGTGGLRPFVRAA